MTNYYLILDDALCQTPQIWDEKDISDAERSFYMNPGSLKMDDYCTTKVERNGEYFTGKENASQGLWFAIQTCDFNKTNVTFGWGYTEQEAISNLNKIL